MQKCKIIQNFFRWTEEIDQHFEKIKNFMDI